MRAALTRRRDDATWMDREIGRPTLRLRCVAGSDADDKILAGAVSGRVASRQRVESSKPTRPAKAKRILIVEDEMITALAAKGLLRTAGYEVVGIVTSAAEAVRRADETRPDLILMDIRLRGDSDGIAAAAEIRNRFDLPSLFLSAYGETKIRNRAELARPVGFVTKPYSPEELLAAIRGAFRS